MSDSRTVLSVFALAPIRIGGVETFARELSSQLAEKGWRSVLCFLSAPQSDEIRQFIQLPNVTIEILNDSSKPSLTVLRRLGGLLARHKPEVLHLHFTPYVSPYPWLARFTGVKSVFLTGRSSQPAGWRVSQHPLWKRALIRSINAPLTKAFCVSEYKRNCLTEKGGFPAARIERVYNGVDLGKANEAANKAEDCRRRYRIPSDRIVILQVAWMIPEKGFVELLHAAKCAIGRNPNIHLILAGEGPCRQDYVRLAETLGISDHVTFTGLVQDPTAEGIYAAADVVCQLSQWEEAFGFTIAEAMSAGKPLIASRVGGIPELVADGVSGFLVDRTDVAATAERILQLASDPARRMSMGQMGRQVCEEKFDVKKNVARLVQFYALSENGGPRDLTLIAGR